MNEGIPEKAEASVEKTEDVVDHADALLEQIDETLEGEARYSAIADLMKECELGTQYYLVEALGVKLKAEQEADNYHPIDQLNSTSTRLKSKIDELRTSLDESKSRIDNLPSED